MTTELIGFEIRARWADAALDGARRLTGDSPPEATAEVFGAAEELTASLERLWRSVEQELEVHGMGVARAGEIVSGMEAVHSATVRTLDELGPRLEAAAGPAHVRELRGRLDRIREHVGGLRAFVERPIPASDPERFRRSMEEMERGEGVDVEDLLRELRSEAGS